MSPPITRPPLKKRRLIWLALFLLPLLVGGIYYVRSHAVNPWSHLPRNQKIATWKPMQDASQFVCQHEANVVTFDAQADRWNLLALHMTRPALWAKERDYKQAFALFQKGAERKYWKSMNNLANAYFNGEGVRQDPEKGVQIVEEMMTLGMPQGYYMMGVLYGQGQDVPYDKPRYYAYLAKAAQMGSPIAQTFLAKRLFRIPSTADNVDSWANLPLSLKLLECAYAQEHGPAADELARSYQVLDMKTREERMVILQNGAKWGSFEAAISLAVRNDKEEERLQLYTLIGRKLEYNPHIRLPNLDKVIPLAPAPIPSHKGVSDADLFKRAQDPAQLLPDAIPFPIKPKSEAPSTS